MTGSGMFFASVRLYYDHFRPSPRENIYQQQLYAERTKSHLQKAPKTIFFRRLRASTHSRMLKGRKPWLTSKQWATLRRCGHGCVVTPPMIGNITWSMWPSSTETGLIAVRSQILPRTENAVPTVRHCGSQNREPCVLTLAPRFFNGQTLI